MKDGGEGFRESTTLDTATDELVRKGGLTPVASATAIAQLVDARLLTSEERGGIRRIELTHDILTSVARRHGRSWQRFRLIGFDQLE